MINPKVSVVVPTMNEEITIGKFLAWCTEGFNRAKVSGEIIILDSSTDSTAQIARDYGAKVIEVKQKGLGAAYASGQNHARGEWIIMGDADCTYDFREISLFIEQLSNGFDLVLGNRFKGSIERDAMPIHHQYFGSPATSLIFKTGLGLPTGDIHCGMRAMTNELYRSLPFLEKGWEYATEMIVSARNLGAKITEIPIDFYKEPEGRLSHHRRNSWLSPFRAGWGTLRVTTTYLIDRIFVVPGLITLGLSALLNIGFLIFPNTFVNLLHAGLLSQSILMFISSIGAFAFTSGLLARFAYRRKLLSLNFLAHESTVIKMFSILVVATLIESSLTFKALLDWIKGLNSDLNQIGYSKSLISGWLSFTSIYLCVLSVSIASLIGNHAQKFQER